jgi:hypothetical protein
MATPMITRRGGYPVRYAKPGASARLAARARPPAITSRSSIASPGIETNRCQARGRKRTRRCLALHSANFGIDDGGAGLRLRHADFAKVIKRGDYKVFLTPEGDCRGLYVRRKSAASFEVRELTHPTGGAMTPSKTRPPSGPPPVFPEINSRR